MFLDPRNTPITLSLFILNLLFLCQHEVQFYPDQSEINTLNMPTPAQHMQSQGKHDGRFPAC